MAVDGVLLSSVMEWMQFRKYLIMSYHALIFVCEKEGAYLVKSQSDYNFFFHCVGVRQDVWLLSFLTSLLCSICLFFNGCNIFPRCSGYLELRKNVSLLFSFIVS